MDAMPAATLLQRQVTAPLEPGVARQGPPRAEVRITSAGRDHDAVGDGFDEQVTPGRGDCRPRTVALIDIEQNIGFRAG